MCIDEIDDILRPDSEPSTWSYKEFEIISRPCKYPFHFPTTKPEKFSDVANISVDLAEAIFEIDESQVSKKDVDRPNAGAVSQ